mgnify:CR=1 FL=1
MIPIVYGMRVYRPRKTSTGWYVEQYRVSERTGRTGLTVVTVIPQGVGEAGVDPHFYSIQVPVEQLYDFEGLKRVVGVDYLHPAMTL